MKSAENDEGVWEYQARFGRIFRCSDKETLLKAVREHEIGAAKVFDDAFAGTGDCIFSKSKFLRGDNEAQNIS